MVFWIGCEPCPADDPHRDAVLKIRVTRNLSRRLNRAGNVHVEAGLVAVLRAIGRRRGKCTPMGGRFAFSEGVGAL